MEYVSIGGIYVIHDGLWGVCVRSGIGSVLLAWGV